MDQVRADPHVEDHPELRVLEHSVRVLVRLPLGGAVLPLRVQLVGLLPLEVQSVQSVHLPLALAFVSFVSW